MAALGIARTLTASFAYGNSV